MGRIGRYRPQGAFDDCGDLIIIDRPWPTGAGLIQKPLDTILQETPPPFADRVFMHAQFRSDDLAPDAIGAAQNDPASL
jgi:hypothetical protein